MSNLTTITQIAIWKIIKIKILWSLFYLYFLIYHILLPLSDQFVIQIRFFVRFFGSPSLQAYTKNSQNKLQKEHSNLLSKQAIYHLFLYKAHHLSSYYNLSAVVMDQLAIQKYYAQLELDKQTKFHINNIEKKISCLYTLIKMKLQKVATMKQDIVFLQLKKVECKNVIRFL